MDILCQKMMNYFNEYIPQFNDRLKFISSFSGSYGIAIIMKKKIICLEMEDINLQAKIQSGKLFNIALILKNSLNLFSKSKNLKIGFDPKLHTNRF